MNNTSKSKVPPLFLLDPTLLGGLDDSPNIPPYENTFQIRCLWK